MTYSRRWHSNVSEEECWTNFQNCACLHYCRAKQSHLISSDNIPDREKSMIKSHCRDHHVESKNCNNAYAVTDSSWTHSWWWLGIWASWRSQLHWYEIMMGRTDQWRASVAHRDHTRLMRRLMIKRCWLCFKLCICLLYGIVVERYHTILTQYSSHKWLMQSSGLIEEIGWYASFLSSWDMIPEKCEKNEEEVLGI